ncbi:MAG: ribonuclease P [Methanomicrobiales archaeon]|nr:ribonuclease P [Methanomicrobiales archaeon]
MKRTDACIFPYPRGDSSLRRMLEEAQELRFDACVAVYDEPLPEGIALPALRGVIVSEDSIKAVVNRLRKVPAGTDLVMIEARDTAFNRGVLSLRGIHILRGIHRSPPRSFDQVSGRLAARNGIAIDLDLSPILSERKGGRQRALQRYEDVLQLQRRIHFPLTISSGARSILGQRSVREITSLCALFGMEKEEVALALAVCGEMQERTGPVTVVA